MSAPKEIVNNNLLDIETPKVLNLNREDELCKEPNTFNENLNKPLELLLEQFIKLKEPKVYFSHDLEALYNVSKNTIYNYRKAGKLNYCSDGQRVWFTKEHIDEFNQSTDCRNKNKLQIAK